MLDKLEAISKYVDQNRIEFYKSSMDFYVFKCSVNGNSVSGVKETVEESFDEFCKQIASLLKKDIKKHNNIIDENRSLVNDKIALLVEVSDQD